MNVQRQLDIVVVAYGYDDVLRQCLTALSADWPVLVIDNSSSSEVAALADQLSVDWDDPGENLGFATAVNRGLRRVRDNSDVLLVNPDAVVSPADVRRLMRDLSDARLGAVAPCLTDFNGSPQRVAWPFPSPWRAVRQALFGGDGGPGPEFVVGAVLLLRREALDDVGLFDERFFLYGEEADWQRRALQRGWTSAVCAQATAKHVGAGTSRDSERRLALFHAGTETYIRKWHGAVGWHIFRAASMLRELVRMIARPGEMTESRARLMLYVRGPRRMAGLNA